MSFCWHRWNSSVHLLSLPSPVRCMDRGAFFPFLNVSLMLALLLLCSLIVSVAGLITPCACARGKVIVVVHTKIARYRDLGVLASGQCCQAVGNGEKRRDFASNDTTLLFNGHAYRPHLVMLLCCFHCACSNR